ncbi:GAF domain-containing protein [Salinigranum sp. GCM10025319]|uniref:GAF domain-containing protein n=1 Tax=Salinigranum sp. GCM10025319 TaxID=3252687 RepID=UPI00360E2446
MAADTREESNDAVCERLADSDLFEFDWIGERDPATDVVDPCAWTGFDSGYPDDLSIPVEDTPTTRDPIGRAVRTGEVQVVADIATESGFAPGRETTLERGVRSAVCVPLVCDDAVHGVLAVSATLPVGRRRAQSGRAVRTR